MKTAWPLETVRYDGKRIYPVPEADVCCQLKLLSGAGINSVMLAGYAELEPASFDLFQESARLGNWLRRQNVSVSQHHGLSPMFAPLGMDQRPVIEQLQRQVVFTKNTGSRVLVIHPGRISGRHDSARSICCGFEEQVEKHSIDAVLKVCAENLRQAGDFALKNGVRIALENVDRFEPAANIELLPRLIFLANHPAIGFCLDSGHAHCCGIDPVRWIKCLNKKLFATHLHDNHGPVPGMSENGYLSSAGIDEHLQPGAGTICWYNVMRALEGCSDLEYYTFETTPTPEKLTADRYLRAILENM